MAFQVTFWNFAKDLNSTKIPDTSGTSFNCVLKSGCSILAPEIILQMAPEATPLYNYAYIPAFERYYRVTNWAWADRLWVASLSVDVLASWKTSIGNATLYILRSADEFNGDIRDDLYPTVNSLSVEASEPDAAPWWYINPEDGWGGSYVVGLISGNGVDYYAMTPATFNAFCEEVLDPTLSNYDGQSTGLADSLAKMIFKPFEYITSVNYIPVSIADLHGQSGTEYVSADVTQWRIGFWSLEMNPLFPLAKLKKNKIFTYRKTIAIPKHPKAAQRGSYLNLSPFTELYVTLPRIGSIALDTSITADCDTLLIELEIDLISGDSLYTLYAYNDTYDAAAFMGRYSCQLGVQVQLAQDTTNVNSIMDSITGAASTAAGVMSASPVQAAGGVASITKLFEPHLSAIGNYGGFLDMNNGAVSMTATFRDVANDDPTHQGRPLMESRQINTLSGFIKCMDATIEIADAMQSELEQIRQHLENGFYYE